MTPLKLVLPVAAVLAAVCGFNAQADDSGRQSPQKMLVLPGEVFDVAGRTAFLSGPAAPMATDTPRPWIFYCPTLQAYPDAAEKWMHEQFVAAGVSVAGVDTGESYGSPQAVKAAEALHAEMVRRGYSTRPAVLGRSRGGLWASAWAIAHPDLTAGVGGIYPVYDWRTYPGLVKAAPAYGLSTEQLEARAADLCPIERIDAAARAGVPFCIIHGDDDKVVPLGPNSAELKKRYEAAGQGELVTLIVVPGQGHSFWEGFFRCQPLVDFLIARAKGRGVATAEAHEPAGTRYPVMSGVGLSLRQKAAHILVGSVLPGGPAARSGVIAPDMRIVSVTCEGKTTLLEAKTIGDAVSLIRGPVGTALTLTIAAADGSEPREVALVRGAVPMVTEATSYGRQVALIHQLRPFQFEYGASSYEPFIGKPIPDLALTSIVDATPSRPADFRGKVLVLDLWASWCPACYGPVDKLQTLAARHPDWAEKVVLATVSIDDKAVDAATVLSQQGWKLTHNFHCDPTAVDALGIKAVPVVIVIKADGTVAAMGEAHAVDVEREVAAALAAP